MTQQQIVLRHLQDYKQITTWDAFREYGITRLSQYIMLLRREGLDISSNDTACTNRYGRKVHFTTYILED